MVVDIGATDFTQTIGNMVANSDGRGSGFPDPSEVEGSRTMVIA